VIHGFHTIFPVPIAMAASWDPKMVEGAQAFAAREARAVGINWTFAPMVDIARDPRWGRSVEGAGEDPYLGAAMSRAQVRGFQGDATFKDKKRVIATMKHFVAHGQPESGMNCAPANVSLRVLRETFLSTFKATIQKAGAISVMASYNEIDGVPAAEIAGCCGTFCERDWKFSGFVVSDANAVNDLQTHGFAECARCRG
jgi:beta-glucosidase